MGYTATRLKRVLCVFVLFSCVTWYGLRWYLQDDATAGTSESPSHVDALSVTVNHQGNLYSVPVLPTTSQWLTSEEDDALVCEHCVPMHHSVHMLTSGHAEMYTNCSCKPQHEHEHNVFKLKEQLNDNPMALCMLFVIIVVLSLLLEMVTHWLEHKFAGHPHLFEILNAVYRELMILGVINLVLFFASQAGLTNASIDGHDFPEVLFEFMHMLIFFLSVFYIATAGLVLYRVRKDFLQWRTLEGTSDIQVRKEYLRMKQLRRSGGSCWCCGNCCCNGRNYWIASQKVKFKRFRQRFLQQRIWHTVYFYIRFARGLVALSVKRGERAKGQEHHSASHASHGDHVDKNKVRFSTAVSSRRKIGFLTRAKLLRQSLESGVETPELKENEVYRCLDDVRFDNFQHALSTRHLMFFLLRVWLLDHFNFGKYLRRTTRSTVIDLIKIDKWVYISLCIMALVNVARVEIFGHYQTGDGGVELFIELEYGVLLAFILFALFIYTRVTRYYALVRSISYHHAKNSVGPDGSDQSRGRGGDSLMIGRSEDPRLHEQRVAKRTQKWSTRLGMVGDDGVEAESPVDPFYQPAVHDQKATAGSGHPTDIHQVYNVVEDDGKTSTLRTFAPHNRDRVRAQSMQTSNGSFADVADVGLVEHTVIGGSPSYSLASEFSDVSEYLYEPKNPEDSWFGDGSVSRTRPSGSGARDRSASAGDVASSNDGDAPMPPPPPGTPPLQSLQAPLMADSSGGPSIQSSGGGSDAGASTAPGPMSMGPEDQGFDDLMDDDEVGSYTLRDVDYDDEDEPGVKSEGASSNVRRAATFAGRSASLLQNSKSVSGYMGQQDFDSCDPFAGAANDDQEADIGASASTDDSWTPMSRTISWKRKSFRHKYWPVDMSRLMWCGCCKRCCCPKPKKDDHDSTHDGEHSGDHHDSSERACCGCSGDSFLIIVLQSFLFVQCFLLGLYCMVFAYRIHEQYETFSAFIVHVLSVLPMLLSTFIIFPSVLPLVSILVHVETLADPSAVEHVLQKMFADQQERRRARIRGRALDAYYDGVADNMNTLEGTAEAVDSKSAGERSSDAGTEVSPTGSASPKDWLVVDADSPQGSKGEAASSQQPESQNDEHITHRHRASISLSRKWVEPVQTQGDEKAVLGHWNSEEFTRGHSYDLGSSSHGSELSVVSSPGDDCLWEWRGFTLDWTEILSVLDRDVDSSYHLQGEMDIARVVVSLPVITSPLLAHDARFSHLVHTAKKSEHHH